MSPPRNPPYRQVTYRIIISKGEIALFFALVERQAADSKIAIQLPTNSRLYRLPIRLIFFDLLPRDLVSVLKELKSGRIVLFAIDR
jgi:hypothetical protein